jgi:thioredoxin-dependent peroxiredoxin
MYKLLTIFVVLLVGFFTIRLVAANRDTQLKLGDPVPAVSGYDQDDKQIDLAKEGAAGYMLVYFYPKAMTPGCTAQACSLRDAYDNLKNKGVKIFGVSVDEVKTQKHFQQKNKLPFELLADPKHEILKSFGVPLMLNLVASRQAYLFKEGKLIWVDTHASTSKQADDVLAVIDKK